MMNSYTIKKAWVSLMTIPLVLGSWAAPVMAAEDATETVLVYAFAEDVSAEVGNVNTTEWSGVFVAADNGCSASLTAGNVSSPQESVIALARNGTADIKVNGTINSATSDGIATIAIGQTGSVRVQAEGDVTAAEAGIFTDAFKGSTTTIAAKGNITSGGYGIRITNEEKESFGKVDISVDGNVTSSKSEAVCMDESVNGGDIGIKIGGDAVSKADDAVYIESYNDTKTRLEVGGNVTGHDDGLYLDADLRGTIDAHVAGNVTSDKGNAVEAYAWRGGKADIRVDGNVAAAEDGDSAVFIDNEIGGEMTIAIGGDVTALSGTAVDAESDDGSKTDITVGGDVSGATGTYLFTAKDDSEDATYPDDPSITFRVEGDLIGTERRGAVIDMEGDGGSIALEVGGDLIGKVGGMATFLEKENEKADVLVAGTIATETGIPIRLAGEVETPDNLSVTVWQVIPKEDIVVGRALYEEEKLIGYERDEAMEKSIHYIIKLEQPAEGGRLCAAKADGSALDPSHDYETALEGDKVLLKVDLDPGYRIKGAFNGHGEKAELIMDSEGKYYVVVPKGGGVYLSVDLEKEEQSESFENGDSTDKERYNAEPSTLAPTSDPAGEKNEESESKPAADPASEKKSGTANTAVSGRTASGIATVSRVASAPATGDESTWMTWLMIFTIAASAYFLVRLAKS